MLIPRGRIIHENLATSYVRVRALVEDLCEGGFSGIVAIELREFDGFIVIAGGHVGAVVEKVNEGERDDARPTYSRSTLSKLADLARGQRALLSVQCYSGATAAAIAGRINAQSLYARLSTEFTDLETMLAKLAREGDREWFVDINTDSDISALIHVRERQFHVIASRGGHDDEWDALDVADDDALNKLFLECNQAAGTFDVYFKGPEPAPVETEAEALVNSSIDGFRNSSYPAVEPQDTFPASPALLNKTTSIEAASAAVANPLTEEIEKELSLGAEESPHDGDDDETMTELKRLMAEIAGTIEGSAQAVDRHDGFGMCLRAAQLQVADRYPFLDPFASEFEYLAGEIVFVGQATAEQFVAGLTESLSLAVKAVAETNAFGEKFRAYVREDLGKLLSRNRTELESYGLDQVIEQIAGS